MSVRARSTASVRAGSTLANGMSTSAFAAAASAISSFGIGGMPLRASQSTVNTTAAMRALAVVGGDVVDRGQRAVGSEVPVRGGT